MTPRNPQWIRLVFGLSLILTMLIPAGAALAQRGTPPTPGQYYVVQRGDTWSNLAARTGVTVRALKSANPRAIHPNDWLWAGERLFIPGRAKPSAQPTRVIPPTKAVQPTPVTQSGAGGYWYTVKQGDTWVIVSRDTGVSVLDLWHANPSVRRPRQWLWVGDRLWIPGKGAEQPATSEVAITETAEPTVTLEMATTLMPESSLTVVPTMTLVSPLPSVAETPAVPATVVPTQVATPLPLPTPTPVPAVATLASPTEAPALPACPGDFAAYPGAITAFLNGSGNTVNGLWSWLRDCGAVNDKLGGVIPASIQKPGIQDIVVAVHDPKADSMAPRGALLIYFARSSGYVLAAQADGAGKIEVLRADDVNEDGKQDIVWTDTSCGAQTCFSTLFVASWDGTAFKNWIEGNPTMAEGTYTFANTIPGGSASGYEILAHGGVVDSDGAGPQRSWTETYVSPEGGPYKLYGQVYDKSSCLYDAILDANKQFDTWPQAGFAPATAAYEAAIDDTSLAACGTITDELAVLRDFARFRLAVAAVGSGKPVQAGKIRDEITTPALHGAANAFLDSYTSTRSAIQACRDTTVYAQAHPEAWQFLADWGYANPSFTAEDLCPLAN